MVTQQTIGKVVLMTKVTGVTDLAKSVGHSQHLEFLSQK